MSKLIPGNKYINLPISTCSSYIYMGEHANMQFFYDGFTCLGLCSEDSKVLHKIRHFEEEKASWGGRE